MLTLDTCNLPMHLQRGPTEVSGIIAVESVFPAKLVYANDQGEIAFYGSESPPTKVRAEATITSMMAISDDLMLVFYDRDNGKSGASVIRTANLQQVEGLTLHEVKGGISVDKTTKPSRNAQSPAFTAIVFTSAALRFLLFDLTVSPKARVVKTIEFKGIVTGSMSADRKSLLVATSSAYHLISLINTSITPLFPIHNNVKPLMVAMGPDFLVAQGTGWDDPAMGLFVDHKGEVARNGIIVEWPTYPIDLVVSGDMVYALCKECIVCHHIRDDAENAGSPNIIDISGKPQRIYKLSYSLEFTHEELVKRLGSISASMDQSDVAFLLDDKCVGLVEPEPELLQLENEIRNGRINQIRLNNFQKHSTSKSFEQKKTQVLYLSYLLILQYLLDDNSAAAISEWRREPDLNIDFVLYLYGYCDKIPVDFFPGLLDLSAKTRTNLSHSGLDFLRYCLRSEINKLRRSKDHCDLKKLQELELLYAQLIYKHPLHDNKHSLNRFILEKELRSRSAILKWLKDIDEFRQIKSYYSLSGDTASLNQLNFEILRSPKCSKSLVESAAKELAEHALKSASLVSSTQSNLDPWDVAVELLNNSKVDTSLGLKVLTSPQFENLYDPSQILQVLKEHTNSGPQWRKYLKHLVETRGLFKNDLASLVVSDIIECIQSDNTHALEGVQKSYDLYMKTSWPKPSYNIWLINASNIGTRYDTNLMKYQIEFWELMERDLNWADVMSIFESQLVPLKFERAKIYMHLNLHEQSLALFNEINDYKSILDYSTEIKDLHMQRDIAKLSFRSVLKIESEEKNCILREFLDLEIAQSLDFNFLLANISDSRPFYAIADYIVSKMKIIESQQRQEQMKYVIAKANIT